MRAPRSVVLVLALLLTACAGSAQAPVPLDDAGLVVADHAGATLVIATLDPAALGENTVRVFMRDTGGKPVGGSAHVSLRRGTTEVAASDVAAGGSTTLMVAAADSYELVVEARPDGQPAGGVGSFVYVFAYDYQAPDRIRYSFVGPDGGIHETVIVGTRRFDRDGHGPWTTSDLGSSLTTASFSFADAPHRVRQIGSEVLDGREALVIALASGAPPYERYYRLWIDAFDSRVLRYTMMATGHYMGGSYRDFNAPIEVAPPTQ